MLAATLEGEVTTIGTLLALRHEGWEVTSRPSSMIGGLGAALLVGMNAAGANAVFHATGRRVRALPIRIENLL